MQQKQLIAVLIAVLVVGGLGFYGGMQYGKNGNAAAVYGAGRFGQGMMNGTQGTRAGMMRNGASAGEILSKDDTSFTLKMGDSGSRIIFFSTTTTVTKSVPGSMSDLTVGQYVSVFGTPNQDGSVIAQSVQIRPAPPAGDAGSPQGGMMQRGAQQTQ
jgi:hypothetical protein